MIAFIFPSLPPSTVANISWKIFLDALSFQKFPSKLVPPPPPNFLMLPTPLGLARFAGLPFERGEISPFRCPSRFGPLSKWTGESISASELPSRIWTPRVFYHCIVTDSSTVPNTASNAKDHGNAPRRFAQKPNPFPSYNASDWGRVRYSNITQASYSPEYITPTQRISYFESFIKAF